jgi:hypothetical protein
MKIKTHIPLLILACFFMTISVVGQDIWRKVSNTHSFVTSELAFRKAAPSNFELYATDVKLLQTALLYAPPRTLKSATSVVIKLPTPMGVQRFLVKEASVFSDELAAKFPHIKSYVGVGLDDPTAVARFSKSVKGFHAMISSGNYPMYLIDPYTKDTHTSIAYFKKNGTKSDFECLVSESKKPFDNTTASSMMSDGKLRTYRLALIATGEYSQFHLTGSTAITDADKKAEVLAAMNTTMTRVNGIFERDLGVTMEIVSNNTSLIFLDTATDNLTDDDADSLISESQTLCDATIGTSNYDIGHAFSTGAGGLAGLGVVCVVGQKALGVTGSSNPVGDTFDIDYVAHEIGHQFGANHTQNNDCQRNGATAVEPGSASTIMGYAGICSPNVQMNSDAYFHAVSIAEMWSSVTITATCAVETATNNATPVVSAGTDFVIPKATAFVLKGSATDADTGNSLTYNWEQIDAEIAEMSPSLTSTEGPAFRSLPSSTSPNRYMPAIATVLSGYTASIWEVISTVARVYNFSLTVRDNVASGGATGRDDVIITADVNSGPFKVTSQGLAVSLNGNSTQTIAWDVANTDGVSVNCTHVTILLSTDGGLTYPNVLLANTPNDGTEDVTLTNTTTTKARIKVEAVDNIFYAVNTTNFSIDEVVVSVDEFSFANFKIYPNPSKGKITISFDVVSTDKVTVQLVDLLGRLVDERVYVNTATTFSEEINYDNVTSGLYLLHIKNGVKKSTKKLIIN